MATTFKSPELCTSCIKLGVKNPQILQEPLVRHCGISRIDGKTYICGRCERAEAYADEWKMPLGEARQQIEYGSVSPR